MDLAQFSLISWMIVLIFSCYIELSWSFSSHSSLKSHENSGEPFEIVSISRDWTKERGDWDLEFEAFDRSFKIRMKQNSHLVAPTLRIVEKSSFSDRVINPQRLRNCHWLGKDGQNILASISDCTEKELTGIVLMEDGILEIQPLTDPIQRALIAEDDPRENLHIIRRTITIPPIQSPTRKSPPIRRNLTQTVDRMLGRSSNQRLTIDVALFLDQAGYEMFAPLLQYNVDQITDLLLAYLSGVQALFHHPSLGEPIDIVLVHLEIMKQQPFNLPTHGGDDIPLLNSFRGYQEQKNPRAGEIGHWDIGIYLTGLDLFRWENERKVLLTTGLAYQGRVCSHNYNCLAVEFGVNDPRRPEKISGFFSIYTLAHEIGHSLGMWHDSEVTAAACPREGFIMSPSISPEERSWSECSRKAISDLKSRPPCLLDQSKEIKPDYDAVGRFKGRPGQVFTAKRQCEIRMNDVFAIPVLQNGLDKICQNLLCASPYRDSNIYIAGPALEGTTCGYSKWCSWGECV